MEQPPPGLWLAPLLSIEQHSRSRSKSGPTTSSIRSPAGAVGAQGLGGGLEGGPEEHTVFDQELSDHG